MPSHGTTTARDTPAMLQTSHRLMALASFPPTPPGPSAAAASPFPQTPTPGSIPAPPPPTQTQTRPKKGPSTRRALSCLPCRRHKLKCDRHVPCHSCTRYRREDLCRKHPAPSSLLDSASCIPKRPAASIPAAVSETSPPIQISPYADSSHNPPLPASYGHADTINFAHPASVTDRATTSPHIPHVGGTLATTPAVPAQSQPPTELAQHLAGTSVLSGSLPFLISAGQSPVRQAEVATFWKVQLTSFLPTQPQCDYLVTYYLEHLNWVHHAIHAPSFQNAYAAFWNTNVEDVNLIWLSLLYSIISCSAIYIPFHTAQAAGLDQTTIRLRAHQWHSASRQALDAGNYESKPSLAQLETFLVTQLYWLATKNIEAMNS